MANLHIIALLLVFYEAKSAKFRFFEWHKPDNQKLVKICGALTLHLKKFDKPDSIQ